MPNDRVASEAGTAFLNVVSRAVVVGKWEGISKMLCWFAVGSQTIPVGDLDLLDFELDLWDLPYLECTSHHPNATLLQCFSVFVLMV